MNDLASSGEGGYMNDLASSGESSLSNFHRNGYIVLEDIVNTSSIDEVAEEVLNAQREIFSNITNIRAYLQENPYASDESLLRQTNLTLRPSGREGYACKPPSDLIYMHRFAAFLGHPTFTGLLSRLFNTEVRLCQIHPKIIAVSKDNSFQGGIDNLKIDRLYAGNSLGREYHRDWPHDLTGYGGGDPKENIGCLAFPFPDTVMCVTAIHYLGDTDSDSGATWVIPGSHLWKDDPRDPNTSVCLAAPIPGERVVTVKAGSVLMMDSRLWHSSPLHNKSAKPRIAVVSRWTPWWMNIQDFGAGSHLNVVCRPLDERDFESLPDIIKPYIMHLRNYAPRELQKSILDLGARAAEKMRIDHGIFIRNSNKPDVLKSLNKSFVPRTR